MLTDDAHFSVIDVETTGRSAERDRLTEVALVTVRGGSINSEYSSLINPGRFVPREVQDLTGITNGMVSDAPSQESVLSELCGKLREPTVVVAHNLRFDLAFLDRAFKEAGLPSLPSERICTLRLARRLMPRRRHFDLPSLAASLGIRRGRAHRAESDAFVAAHVLIKLLGLAWERGIESLDELLKYQYAQRRGRTGRSAERRIGIDLKNVPTSPGVYRMLDDRGDVLYVGKAKSLRHRLTSYFRGTRDTPVKVRRLMRVTASIQYDEMASELDALVHELRQIKSLQPRFNSAGKRDKFFAFIRLDTTDRFPRFEPTRIPNDDGAEYFGPFRSMESVRLILDIVERTYQLRSCSEEIPEDGSMQPCFYHQIDRCSAPCAGHIRPDMYRMEVDRVRSFLTGHADGYESTLRERMQVHAERLEFERAAYIRDRMVDVGRALHWNRLHTRTLRRHNSILVQTGFGTDSAVCTVIWSGLLGRSRTIPLIAPNTLMQKELESLLATNPERTTPRELSRPEFEEMRLITGWLKRNRANGTYTMVDLSESSSLAGLADAVGTAIRGLRTSGTTMCKRIEERERSA